MNYKIIDCSNDNTIFNTKKWIEFTDEVKDALEKQIPKQVNIENDFIWCPVCERGGNGWDKPKYCLNCGQVLKY